MKMSTTIKFINTNVDISIDLILFNISPKTLIV